MLPSASEAPLGAVSYRFKKNVLMLLLQLNHYVKISTNTQIIEAEKNHCLK